MATPKQIYEAYYGVKVRNGFHIHHLDGNNKNNDPANLFLCEPRIHWMIHFLQGDPIAFKGKFIQGASAAGKKANVAMMSRGSHSSQIGVANFQQKGVAARAGAIGRKKAVANGNNNFQNLTYEQRFIAGKKGGSISGPKVAAKYFTAEWQSRAGSAANAAMLASGTHPSQIGRAGFQQLGLAKEAGRVQTQRQHTCPHCGKVGKSNAMFGHHFDRCPHALGS